MKLLAILAVVVVVASSARVTTAFAVDDVGTDDAPAGVRVAPDRIALASYDGRTIDLRDGWGAAAACYVDATATTTCFATEREMDVFIDETGPPGSSGVKSSARIACGSTLRLYDGISYTAGVVAISLRGTLINMSTLGFDNATTSYKVGACSSTFWAGSGGTGGLYPGNTSVGAQSPSMVGGWNDEISSVYLA